VPRRKCFRVMATNPNDARIKLGGWFSYISNSSCAGYFKAAYTTASGEEYLDASLETKLTGDLETVTITGAGTYATCAFVG
jgi:hypothetical protein